VPSVAETIVRTVLSPATCAAVRAARFDECQCNCFGLLVRYVQETIDGDFHSGGAEHRGDICSIVTPTIRPWYRHSALNLSLMVDGRDQRQ